MLTDPFLEGLYQRIPIWCDVHLHQFLSKLGGAGSSAAMYADTKTKLSPFQHALLTLIATISSFENIGIREQQRSGVT